MGAKAIKLGPWDKHVIGISNRKVLGSTPDRSTRIFFSEYACVTFWNNTSFSFIHQAENIPSHLFHKISFVSS